MSRRSPPYSHEAQRAAEHRADTRHARSPARRPGRVRASASVITAVITKLFVQHDVHRVYAQADDRNLAVQRLLERLGFRCEAPLVEADWFKW
jgi:hypothetical protein